MQNRSLVGMAFATLAAALWALTLGASRLLPSGFSTAELVWGRYGVQLLLLAVLVLPFRGRSLVRTSRPRLQALRGATMLVMPVAFTLAIHRMGAAEAWAALWFAPLFGMILARRVVGEPTPLSSWIVVLVATLGTVVLHGPTAMPHIPGLIAVVGSAVAFGAFLVLTRALKSENATTGLFWTAACVFIPVSLFVLFRWEPVTPRILVGIAVMGTLWLFVLFALDEALRRAPLALLAPFLLSEIIWTRLLFRIPWTAGAEVGALTVFAAAAWCIYSAWSPRGFSSSLGAEVG